MAMLRSYGPSVLGAGQKYNKPPLSLGVSVMLKCNRDH